VSLHVTAATVAAIFVLLALVHVYWASGGRRLKGAAVPERDGRAAFVPTRAATLGVAGALAAAAAIVAETGGLVITPVSPQAAVWLVYALGALFVARAVGDFRFVGVFKRIRGTRFARLDSLVYVPLCLLLAAGLVAVAVLRSC
jgi:hypothetical protein